MKKFLDFLSQHKSLNLLLVVLYYLLVVLPHEYFGKIIADTFNQMGRSVYQLLMLSFSILFILIYLYFVSRSLLKLRGIGAYLFLLVLIILTAVSYPLIIIHYVEAIHFLQYAILAFLLFPIFRNYYKVIFWGLLLGFADEAYQHFFLDPGSKYFDFNDVLLNEIGLCWGLFPIALLNWPLQLSNGWHFKKYLSEYLGLIVIILAVILAFSFKVMIMHSNSDGGLVLIKGDYAGFWESIPHLETKYHIVRPFEGLVLITVLYFYFCIGLNKIQNSKQRQIEQGPDKR